MDAAKVRILLEADSSGIGKGVHTGIGLLGDFETKTKAILGKVGKAWDALSGGQKALAGLGLGIGALTAAMAASIKPAIEFESAFAGVRKTVDTTPAGLAAIRNGLLDLSKVMPTSANDLAGIAEAAGQLGVKAPDILGFTKVIAQLGETTDLSLDAASTQLARFLNLTGLGPAAIGHVADAVVALGNAGASTESEIVAMSMRLVSAFTVAGASADQILGLSEVLVSSGLNAEAGGSALSVVITKLSDAAKLGGADLATFAQTAGMLPDQFAAMAKSNPVEALLAFADGLAKINTDGKSITPVLESLKIQGIRTSDALRLLSLNTGHVREQLQLSADAFKNGGANQAEYDKRMETTASRLETLRNRITALQINVGTPLLGGLVKGVDLAGDAIDGLVKMLTPLGVELRALFANGAELAGVFWAAMGSPLAKAAVGALIGATVALTGLLHTLNAAGPAGLVLAYLVGEIVLVGPGSVAAASGLKVLSVAMAESGASGVAAAAGLKAYNLAASIGPTALLVAGLALVGKAFHDADTQARATADGFTKAFGQAAKNGDIDAMIRQTDQLERKLAELRKEGHRDDFLSGLGLALKGTFQLLPGIDNTVVNSAKGLKELQATADANDWTGYVAKLDFMAQRLGLSRDATVKLAQSQGVLDKLLTGTHDEWLAARKAMDEAAGASKKLATELGTTSDELLVGDFNLEKFSKALGVTGDQLEYVAGTIKGFKFEDLYSDDAQKRSIAMAELTRKINDELAPMAKSAHLTTQAFVGQLQAVDSLAGSYGSLQKEIKGTRDALDTIGAQADNAKKAGEAYDKATKGLRNKDQLEKAAKALRDYTLEFAGTGVSAQQALTKQDQLIQGLYKAAVRAGIKPADAAKIIADSGAVAQAQIAQIAQIGQQTSAEAKAVQADLKAVTDTAITPKITVDTTKADAAARKLALQLSDVALTPIDIKAHLMINADTAKTQAREGVTKLANELDPAKAKVDADLDPMRRGLKQATMELDSWAASSNAKAVITLRGGQGNMDFATATGTAFRPTKTFADGGINSAQLEHLGGAKIYRPAPGGRLFAEPATEGEAFIPLGAGNRRRSLEIWAETGRLLGAPIGMTAYAAGGINTAPARAGATHVTQTTTLNAPVRVEVTAGPGMDAGQVAELVGTRVRAALADAGRELLNTRMPWS